MQFRIRIYMIGTVLSVLMILQGCNKTWDDHYNTMDKTTQKDKIVAELEKIPEVSKFAEAVKNYEYLADFLDQNRLYTVFAPVNETFETIDPEILNDEYLFARMILYHFIDGKYKYKDLSYESITTFNDKYLNIFVDSNRVLLDGYASVIYKDFLSQNGIIQVIDKPLIPLLNLHEYFFFNNYSSKFYTAISNYTNKEFNQSASTPVDKNENNEVIYDSVFNISNPFLNLGSEWDGSFYERDIPVFDITDESGEYAFVFPVNYESALGTVKSSPFLNNGIADHDWAGPILASLVFKDIYSKDEILSEIEDFHTYDATEYGDTSKVMLYFANLLKNNYSGNEELSNGMVHLVNGFEYDMSWLITDQVNVKAFEKAKDYAKILLAYQNNLITKAAYSDHVDTVLINLNNIKTIFYNDTNLDGYNSRYGEWVNFELEGSFYPVDYKIMVRGKNFASGTYMIEADGKEIGEYDFSTAPSGDLDTKFDEIGIVKFTETKSVTNLKFTFVNTHPGTNTGEQYLWIKEIKISPVIK